LATPPLYKRPSKNFKPTNTQHICQRQVGSIQFLLTI
jgi:hypothetical protein